MISDDDIPSVEAPLAGADATRPPAGLLLQVLRTTAQNRLALVGAAIAVLIFLFSFVGPLVYHTDQVNTHLLQATLAPSASHPLGTDGVGHDVLGRLMVGGQASLEVGVAAALLASIVGTLWGAIAGYYGGWVDTVMMRMVDSIYAIPPLILLMVLASVFVPSVPVVIVVVAIVSWLAPARLVRGEALSIRLHDYVLAAKAVGMPSWRIILRHIIPNTIGTILVQTTLKIADAILLFAIISYLGLGPPPPATNWGAMLNNGLNYVYNGYWWLIYPPGVAIVLTVMAFNLIGDGLRDGFDIRLMQR